MTKRIFFWAITSALAGFLFGFDTIVISGAEQAIQKLWGLSPALDGLVLGSALYGTVLGSLVGGWPTDRLGRKRTLLFVGMLYVVSAVGCGFATGPAMFVVARILGDLGTLTPKAKIDRYLTVSQEESQAQVVELRARAFPLNR